MKLCPTCQRCYEDAAVFCAVPGHDESLVPSRHGKVLITEKYRLDRLLGRGGMGAVYAGTHVELDRLVAIKLLLPDFSADPQAMERFRREARASARVNHQNVAGVYDFGVTPGGEAYIVMELIEGQTLREYLNAFGQFRPDEVAPIAAQIADGVEAAHRQGITHRDLKPSNIILKVDAADGRLTAKVVDFGIAKLKEQTANGASSSITASGAFIGTPRYTSPEQCMGLEMDARSDIYSLGVIFYEMLAGAPPFDAPTVMAVALKHIQETPAPLGQVRPDVSPRLAALIGRMMRKDPAERTQTAAEVSRALRDKSGADDAYAADEANQLHTAAFDTAFADGANGGAIGEKRAIQEHFVSPAGHAAPTADAARPLVRREQATNFTNSPTSEEQVVEEPDEASRQLDSPPPKMMPAAKTVSAARPPEDVSAGPPIDDGAETYPDDEAAPPAPRVVPPKRLPLPSFSSGATHHGAAPTSPPPPGALFPPRMPFRAAPALRAAPVASLIALAKSRPQLAIGLVALLFTLIVGAVWLVARRNDAPTLPPSGESAADSPAGQPQQRSTTNAPAAGGNVVAPTAGAPAQIASPNAPPGVSAETERAALRYALKVWTERTNKADAEKLSELYAPKVAVFYLERDVARSAVRREKARLSAPPNSINIQINEADIALERDGRAARMRFNKLYTLGRGRAAKRGEVLQELRWSKTEEGWRITGERDVKVIKRP